jgi:sugar lactone lactonase YvrE
LGWLNANTLIMANQPLGLFLVDITSKKSTRLHFPNIHYINAVAVDSQQGILYFTESSNRYYGEAWKYLYDLLEAKPYGSLYSYHLKTHRLTRLMNNLYYANGVALSPQKDYLLVNETYRYRIHRYWLTGTKAGTNDILIDNLPGFPDGLSLDAQTGHYWVALYTIRNPVLDWLHRSPFLKEQLAKLPRFLWPQPKHYGLILELSPQGHMMNTLQDPTGKIFAISSVRRVGSALYFGSLHGGFIGKYKLPETSVIAPH